MSIRKPFTYYTVLLYIAYVFFIGMGGLWFYQNMAIDKRFNYLAFLMILIFVLQAIFNKLLVNLIIGIISLFLSLVMLLQVVTNYDLMKGKSLDAGGKLLMSISIISLLMSGVLIFSYLVMNKERMKKA